MISHNIKLLGQTCSLTPWKSYFFIWQIFHRCITLKYWETKEFLSASSQISEKPKAMPMRGAVLKFTFHSQNTVILQEAPATWAEQFALSPPCRLARWDAGQSALLKAQTTFGNYCSILAASTRADDSLSLQSQCRPTVQSLELTSQVPLPYWLHISRTRVSFGQYTWDPQTELVFQLCFLRDSSRACTTDTKAPLYSVGKKACVVCSAPQHKSTW